MHEFQLLYVSVCESAAAAKYATVCQIKVTAQPLADSLFTTGSCCRRQEAASLAAPLAAAGQKTPVTELREREATCETLLAQLASPTLKTSKKLAVSPNVSNLQ